MMNEKFMVDVLYDALGRYKLPVVRLDSFNLTIDNCNFVFYVAHKQAAFDGVCNGVRFTPVLFYGQKLLLVVHKDVRVPENVLKITSKILFFGSPDEFVDQIFLMAKYAKEIYARVP